MIKRISMFSEDEEQLEIRINGETVGTYNHDDHGWAGMQAAEQLAEQFAKALGLKIEQDEE